jgi:hypothetical protein
MPPARSCFESDCAGLLLQFFAAQAPYRVAMEACASSHYWSRELSRLGHEVLLIPPSYVKPFVQRLIGANAVVRWAARKGTPAGSWLERMLDASRACSAQSRSRTKWHGSFGPCRLREGFIEFRSRRHNAGRRLSHVGRSYGGHGAIVDETGSGKPVLDRAPLSAR